MGLEFIVEGVERRDLWCEEGKVVPVQVHSVCVPPLLRFRTIRVHLRHEVEVHRPPETRQRLRWRYPGRVRWRLPSGWFIAVLLGVHQEPSACHQSPIQTLRALRTGETTRLLPSLDVPIVSRVKADVWA